VATYLWSRLPTNKDRFRQHMADCRTAFAHLKELTWTDSDNKSTMLATEQMLLESLEKAESVMIDEDEIQGGVADFIALREDIDELLDEEMQPLAVELLDRPRQDAEAATAVVAAKIGWLIPIWLVSAAMTSLWLTRTVIRPLNRLSNGTEAVSRGDLGYRVAEAGNDEFAMLANAFNHMVARLQETLVSKELLENSERELQRTVRALQGEINERVRAEDERMRLQASLRRTQTLSAMGALVAGVAHQVRNPLFAITSMLDAMEARLGKREDYQQYMELLRNQVDRVARLMTELMEYGRPGTTVQTAGSLEDVVRDAVSACRTIAESAKVSVSVEMNGRVPDVLMDRPRLGRAIENLVENAIQHSRAGETVAITASEVERGDCCWVELCVLDRGPGFRDEDLPHVFDPFFSRRHGGTGLGLALVERIVESHGGLATAACRPGGGAVLTVRLPVVRESVAT
jgi:signal transduction histidine kinase